MAILMLHLVDGRDDSNEKDGGNEVIIAKVVAMVVLFFASFLLGLLPFILSKKFSWIKDDQTAEDIKTSNGVVVGLLSFGGGVLLSTTFLHLLPEVGENIKHLQEDGVISELSFHLESLLMCAGFFTMYLVEEIVHIFIRKRTHQHSRRQTESMLVRTMSVRHSIRHSINNNKPAAITTADLIAKDTEKQTASVSTVIVTPDDEMSHKNNRSHSHLPIIERETEDPIIASLRGLLIVLALSVHELFEGLAVGLESSAQNVWYMFGAVSAHKLVIAFCVGVELVTMKTKTKLIFVYAFAFAVVSPLGIGIGIALSGGEGASASGLPAVILQGLACGTLLYIVFFEILQRDRAGLIQLACCIVGFLAMFGFQFISPHDHGHGHGHDHGKHFDHDHEHDHDHHHDHALDGH